MNRIQKKFSRLTKCYMKGVGIRSHRTASKDVKAILKNYNAEV